MGVMGIANGGVDERSVRTEWNILGVGIYF